MAVSKRLRFEILRRDNHVCRYCGATPPDVKLTVDHVVPVSLGGSDDPSNLVTACHGCNSGKAATSLDAPMVADIAQDALRWSAAMKQAAAKMLADTQARRQALSEFTAKWREWKTGDGSQVALPPAWEASVERFLAAGLPMPMLLECVDIAMGNTKLKVGDIWRYMCGVAWRRITDLQTSAKAIVDTPPAGGVAEEEEADDSERDYLDATVYVYADAIRSLMSVLGKKRSWEVWCSVKELFETNGYETDDEHEMGAWLLRAYASGVAVDYLRKLPSSEWPTWGWPGPTSAAVDLHAVDAARRARQFKEEGIVDLGRCLHVADSLPCSEVAKYHVYIADCPKCVDEPCRGHEGLCEPHLNVAADRGLRHADGSLMGYISDCKEIVDDDAWATV